VIIKFCQIKSQAKNRYQTKWPYPLGHSYFIELFIKTRFLHNEAGAGYWLMLEPVLYTITFSKKQVALFITFFFIPVFYHHPEQQKVNQIKREIMPTADILFRMLSIPKTR